MSLVSQDTRDIVKGQDWGNPWRDLMPAYGDSPGRPTSQIHLGGRA